MKNFLETYSHIINPVLAVAAILGLFYLGSTITPETEITYRSTINPKDKITHNKPVVKTVVIDQLSTPQPDPEPEPIVEPEPVSEEVVEVVVEVVEDTVVTDVVNDTIEVEIDSIEVPVEVEVDTTDTNHMTTDHPEVTVSVNGYLVVPDSVDNIVNAFVYAAERVGRNTHFEWRDSTYTTKNFYDNTKKMNRRQ